MLLNECTLIWRYFQAYDIYWKNVNILHLWMIWPTNMNMNNDNKNGSYTDNNRNWFLFIRAERKHVFVRENKSVRSVNKTLSQLRAYCKPTQHSGSKLRHLRQSSKNKTKKLWKNSWRLMTFTCNICKFCNIPEVL